MVDTTSIVPTVNTTSILNGVLLTLIILLAIGLVGYFTYWYIKKRKYNEYRIVILEKDSTGNTHEYYDRGGIFLDKKTGFKLLFLQRLKKGLNPNNVPYVTSKDKKGRLVKTVYLRRIGVSNYVFLHLKIGEDGVKINVGEEDVNWAAQEIETIKRQYNKENWITKFAPYIMFIITIMIVMIILISLFNKFEVLQTVSDNMLQISAQQAKTTELLYNITSSPTFNPNQPIIVPGVR